MKDINLPIDIDKKKLILDFIKQHKLAVLATVTQDSLPEASVMGFSENDEMALIFGTFVTSRKWENLRHNPKVAVVIGWEGGKTVQYEGTVKQLSGAELEECKQVHLAKMPTAAKFVSRDDEVFFKVTPSWIKYSDMSADPWQTFELRFP